MAERSVRDVAGRTWTCVAEDVGTGTAVDAARQGRDVQLACTTPSVDAPVALTVGWQWEQMAPNGLARMITSKSPVPKR